ncbi:MAG: glycosyltransferase family 2 protein [Pseudorhodobacter sp.]|nr:MAG: glycosyltransferase family 2 protein [Pseudorhodobacter sp.]
MLDLPITHCMTIGNRPDLLRQTLGSLQTLRNLPTIAINDFNDTATNDVLQEMCPNAVIVGPRHHLGHHPAVDQMYSHVKTPYIFHNEDDWEFFRTDFLRDAIALLEAVPLITSVCLRDTDDLVHSYDQCSKIVTDELNGIRFQRLDNLHDQWHGFTFNPHVTKLSTWKGLGGYSQFAKERHVSRHLRSKGQFVAFLRPGACRHSGEGRSSTWKPSQFRRFKAWLRGEKAG